MATKYGGFLKLGFYSILGTAVLLGITTGLVLLIKPAIFRSGSSLKSVKQQVLKIQKELNKDNNYALTQEDLNFLKTQGLLSQKISQKNEIKTWVK